MIAHAYVMATYSIPPLQGVRISPLFLAVPLTFGPSLASPPRSAADMALPLEKLERTHEILARISEGGMGTVYKVRHRLLEELRAAKVMKAGLSDSEEIKARFMIEARTAASLRHPNIAILYDFRVEEDGTGVILMEYIDGVTLQEAIHRSSPLPLPLVLVIAEQTLSALDYLHSAGLVHRDIAPDNVMVTVRGGQPLIKLIDLGIAKALEEKHDLTASGRFLGKVRYASPELLQTTETIDARSDLYSFGVVLYELLTGCYPIPGKNIQSIIAGHLWGDVGDFESDDPTGRLPQNLRDLVLKMLEKDPEDRPKTAREVFDVLSGLRREFDTTGNAAALEEIVAQVTLDPDSVLAPPLPPPQGFVAGPDELTERFEIVGSGNSFDDLLDQANQALESGDYAQARTFATEALAVHPDSHRARMLLTAAEMAERRLEASRALEGIESLLEQQRLADAFAELVKWRSQFPNDPRFDELESKLDAATHDLKVRKQKRAEHKQMEVVLERAHRALVESKYDAAREAVEKVLELEPKNDSARALLSSICAAEEEAAKAQRAKEIEEQVAQLVRSGRGSQLEAEMSELAEVLEGSQLVEAQARIRDGQIQWSLAEGRKKLELGEAEAARGNLLDVLALDPQHTVAEQLAVDVDKIIEDQMQRIREQLESAASERSAGNFEQAREHYGSVLEIEPKNLAARTGLSEIDELQEELAKRERDAQAHLRASESLQAEGRLDEAASAAAAALDVDPASTLAQQRLEDLTAAAEEERRRQDFLERFETFKAELLGLLASNVDAARSKLESAPTELQDFGRFVELTAAVEGGERELRRLLDQASAEILDDRLDAAAATLDRALERAPENPRSLRLKQRIDAYLRDRIDREERERAVASEIEGLREIAESDLHRAELQLQTAIAKHGPHELFDDVRTEIEAALTEAQVAEAQTLLAEVREALESEAIERAAEPLEQLEALDLPAGIVLEIEALEARYREQVEAAETRQALAETTLELDRLLEVNDLERAREVLRTAHQRFGHIEELEPAAIAIDCLEGQERRVQMEQVEMDVRGRLEAGDTQSALKSLERGQEKVGEDPALDQLRHEIREAMEETGAVEAPTEDGPSEAPTIAARMPSEAPTEAFAMSSAVPNSEQETSEIEAIQSELETAVHEGNLQGARSMLDALSPAQQLTLGSFRVHLEELEEDFRTHQLEMLRQQASDQRDADDLRGALKSLREAVSLAPEDADLTTEIHWIQKEIRDQRSAAARTNRLGAEIGAIEELWNKGRVRTALKHLDRVALKLDATEELSALRNQLVAEIPTGLRDRRLWLAAAVALPTLVLGFVLGTRTAPAPDLPEAVLVINALPWAEVIAIDPATGGSVELGEDRSTPLRVLIPTGSYSVQLRGPSGDQTALEVEVPPAGTSVVHSFQQGDLDGFLEEIDRGGGLQETTASR
ncbi:MAG: protein kinase [Acidobacteriota bacterium]